ncbi:MAG: hypothetical protein OHK93_008012 [Ramalina farinacea]|uniref:EXPERA domain-containing protein n=1 Tax=Ramalina farinacea TaxID=258253 RepID=A0AA43QLM0_9LECA|nr:hypothetical protein [Ramalina farinacea]
MPPLQTLLTPLYLLFFTIHIPIMLLVDLYPLYPVPLRPAPLTKLRAWYVEGYKDRFFMEKGVGMEGVGAPACVVALMRLRVGKDSPTLNLTLLLFALQTALTTAVCVAEYRSWPELTPAEKTSLGGLYVPYLVFEGSGGVAMVMGVDMFDRVRRVLVQVEFGGNVRKTE